MATASALPATLMGFAMLIAAQADQRVPSQPTSRPDGEWTISTERRQGERTVVATLRADTPVAVGDGEVVPAIVVRCGDRAVEVLIHFGAEFHFRPPLRWTWDGRKLLDYYWTVSSDSRALIAQAPLRWFDPWAVRQLAVEFQPRASAPRMATFTMTGTGSAMKQLAESCPLVGERLGQEWREPRYDFTWDPSLAPVPPRDLTCCGDPPPTKVKHVAPVYPAEALEARVQGIVVVQLFIDARGAVRDARVTGSVPPLDAAALEAVRQWIFTPPMADGVAVPAVYTVFVEFNAPEVDGG